MSTQTEFINTLHENLASKDWDGLTKKDVKEFMDTVSETMIQILKKKPPTGKNAIVVLPSIGRVTVVKKPARMGIKPFSSPPEKMKFKASKKARVTLAKPMKDAISSIK